MLETKFYNYYLLIIYNYIIDNIIKYLLKIDDKLISQNNNMLVIIITHILLNIWVNINIFTIKEYNNIYTNLQSAENHKLSKIKPRGLFPKENSLVGNNKGF